MRIDNRKNCHLQETHSSYSSISPFLKLQSLFLQKFFRYNLQDYFGEIFTRCQDNCDFARSNNKELQLLQNLTFCLKSDLHVQSFSSKLNQFYSSSQVNFKYLYSNCQRKQLLAKEKVIVWVKMRCDSQSLENLPDHIQEQLTKFTNASYCNEQCETKMHNLTNNPQNAVNLLIVYFGDMNFHILDKKNYELKSMRLFGRVSPVNIHVFYVSRVALINKFKEIIKIKHLDSLDEFIIKFYEAKRQKLRKKIRKHLAMAQRASKQNELSRKRNILKWSLLFSVGGITVLLFKLVR